MTKKDSLDSELTDSEKFGLEPWNGLNISLFNPLSWIIAFPFLGIYIFFVIDEKKKKKDSIKDEKEWEEEKNSSNRRKENEISIKKLSWEESVKSLKNKYLKNSQYWETSIGLKFETLDYWNPLSMNIKFVKNWKQRIVNYLNF